MIFMKNPENMRIEMLNPTEYKIVSVFPSLCNLRILNIIIPGINVRKTKGINCLKIGISKLMKSKAIRPKKAIWKADIIIKNFLIGQSFI